MHRIIATIRIALLDMRGDLRRFGLLIACLAVGTALIAGVSAVGASIRQAVETDAALLMGGDIELTRGDRPATADELAVLRSFGQVSHVVDTNVRAEFGDATAFVDLIAVGDTYPLLGQVGSPQLPFGANVAEFLGPVDGMPGALVDPLMLDELGAGVGDTIQIGGTPFTVRGVLTGVPDGAVRGLRLGSATVITVEALGTVADRTSPLPGLGTWFRYKVLLNEGDGESGKIAAGEALNDPAWTIRSARDGLGEMVRYYDIFMRFLVVVGLASLLIAGVSVWTGVSDYVGERSGVIAVMRSMGARRQRIFAHFLAQIAAIAATGVGIGVIIGAVAAVVALPIVAESVGVGLSPTLPIQPLLVAAGIGLVTAFAFAYLPLQQAQSISPANLFRAKGLGAPPIDWRVIAFSPKVLPLVVSAAVFLWLAIVMTNDPVLVAAFALVSIIAVAIFRFGIAAATYAIEHLPEPRNRILRHALRQIAGSRAGASAVVISVGMAIAMLVVVLVLQLNLRNEYLGASVFDAPTFVAADLFSDEVEQLEAMQRAGGDVESFTSTPMLRGALVAVNGRPASEIGARGPEASFLLSGEVPLTFRAVVPASSRLVEGQYWPPDYQGPPAVSLHQNLRAGLGVGLGDRLTFEIFGEQITAEIVNFRDYSWQGGIDFLATFAPGAIEQFPMTLLGSVTAVPGREADLERELAAALPDVRFIAIGETLRQITAALGQLALAASLVGGLAVGNGLLVLVGSLVTGRRQRQIDTTITKVLGAKRFELVAVPVVNYVLLGAFASLLAIPLGIIIAYVLTLVMLNVQFAVDPATLAVVDFVAIAITGLLGATTVYRVLVVRAARLLREF